MRPSQNLESFNKYYKSELEDRDNQEHSFKFYNDEILEDCTLTILTNMFIDGYSTQLEKWQTSTNYQVEPKYFNIPFNDGILDEYQFSVNRKAFTNRIYYTKINNVLKNIHDINIINKLQPIENEYIATFKFIDANHQLNITGDMGIFAKEVMQHVLDTTKDSIDRNRDKIIGFYYSVDRNESKRIKFYDKIIEQIVQYKEKIVYDTGKHVIMIVYIF